MEDFQLKLLLKNSYQSLSNDEKTALKEWCENEDEFQSLKHLFIGVAASKKSLQDNLNTKKQLDELFDNKFKTTNRFDWKSFLFPSGVLFFRMPAFQMAFGAIILVGLTYLFMPKDQVQMAKNNSVKLNKTNTRPVESKLKQENSNLANSEEKLNLKNESTPVSTVKEIEDQIILSNSFQASASSTDDFEEKAIAFDLNASNSITTASIPTASSNVTVTGGTYAWGYVDKDVAVSDEEDNSKKSSIQPVSSKPGVLDYLYTTY